MGIDRIPLPHTDGALWLCARRDVASDPDAALRAAGGASTVACLLPSDEVEYRSPEYLTWLRTHRGGKALWFPVANYEAPSARSVLPFLRMLEARLDQGEGVVMHCALGQGRAGTLAVCLLMVLGADRRTAQTTVASHRAMAGPGNPEQMGLILDVEAELAQ